MLLFLLRHGQSEANRIGAEAGSDSPLSELGWRQARAAGKWLKGMGHFDALYCSSLVRARQTAEEVSKHIEAPDPILLDTLRESDFVMTDIMPRFSHPLSTDREACTRQMPEEYRSFRRQILSALEMILSQALEHSHERMLVISHGGSMGTMVRLLLGSDGVSVWSQNCCTHCLGWFGARWEIRYLNRIDYLNGLETP